MLRRFARGAALLPLLVLTSGAGSEPVAGLVAGPAARAQPSPASPARSALSIAAAHDSGVLIVISKASQRMEVFRAGQPWLSAPVSTGRPGHRTPAGVFPILEKRRYHRSNLYSNAPMPFMQRLTRGGIAIHAGRLPGYPASHGCVRVPYGVAATLFRLTSPRDTLVVIVNPPVHSAETARRLALGWPEAPAVRPAGDPAIPAGPPRLATAAVLEEAGLPGEARLPGDWAAPPVASAPAAGPRAPGQTIQLTAALSPAAAEAHWVQLLGRHAGLAGLRKSVIPVVIGTRRLYRLRASGPGAFASCAQLQSAGAACFKVL